MAGGDDLERWAAEARADDAIAQRMRETSLRRQVRDDVSVASLAADLAEGGAIVHLTLEGGGTVRGVLRGVGSDHLDVVAGGLRALVPLRSVMLLEGAPDRPLRAAGDRSASAGRTLVVALAELADEHADVRVELRGDAGAVSGRVARAGQDVLVVDREPQGPAAVALRAVAVVWCGAMTA